MDVNPGAIVQTVLGGLVVASVVGLLKLFGRHERLDERVTDAEEKIRAEATERQQGDAAITARVAGIEQAIQLLSPMPRLLEAVAAELSEVRRESTRTGKAVAWLAGRMGGGLPTDEP